MLDMCPSNCCPNLPSIQTALQQSSTSLSASTAFLSWIDDWLATDSRIASQWTLLFSLNLPSRFSLIILCIWRSGYLLIGDVKWQQYLAARPKCPSHEGEYLACFKDLNMIVPIACLVSLSSILFNTSWRSLGLTSDLPIRMLYPLAWTKFLSVKIFSRSGSSCILQTNGYLSQQQCSAMVSLAKSINSSISLFDVLLS